MKISTVYLRLFLLIFAVAYAQVAAAVCFNGNPSIEKEYDQSELVFIGHVLSEKATSESKNYLEGTMYVVAVDEAFKGKLPAAVEIFSENSSGRFPMAPGQRYLIFGYRALGRVMIDNCGNSGLLADNAEALEAVWRRAKQTTK